MRMKAKKKYTLLFIIPLLIFFSENVWNIRYFGEEQVSELFYRNASIFVVLFYFFITGSFLEFFKVRNLYNNLWLLFFISITISYLYGSYYINKESLLGLFKAYFSFSGILLYFILIRKFNKIVYAQYVLKIIVSIGVFSSLFMIFCSLTEVNIFLDENFYTHSRFGFTRVAGFGENSIVIAFLFAFFSLNSGKIYNKKLLFSILIITGFCLFFVMMSRQILISLLIILGFFVLKNAFKNRKTFKGLLFFMVVCLFFFNEISSYFITFFDSMDQGNGSIANQSVEIRALALNYYADMASLTNGIGFGWIPVYSDVNKNDLSYATNFLNFRLVDLGIFSTYFMFGILGLIVTFLFYIKSFKYLNRYPYSVSLEKNILIYFLVFKIVSLNYIFYWPTFTIIFAIVAFLIESFGARENQNQIEDINLSAE